MKTKQKSPLVSIIVVTYNSAKFVLETLESAKNQTYDNIELIITDDCSIDNTFQICSDWLCKNKKSFIRTSIVTNKKNKGVAGNCNKGLQQAKGDWVKLIAGDDVLCKDAVQNVIEFIEENPDSKVVFGNILNIINGKIKPRQNKKINYCPENKQKILVSKGYLPYAPSMFIEGKLIKQIHGFDENYPFMEDFPFFFKLANLGIPFKFLNKYVVLYRLHDHNISTNILFIRDYENFVFNEIIPVLKQRLDVTSYLHFYNLIFIRRLNLKLKGDYPKISRILGHMVFRNLFENFSKKINKK